MESLKKSVPLPASLLLSSITASSLHVPGKAQEGSVHVLVFPCGFVKRPPAK